MDYALKSLKMRADSGDIEAMVELGNKFADGEGVRQSDKKAEKYFKMAALRNCAEGYIGLGNLKLKDYFYGKQLAEEMWTKADSLGSVEAAYLIGQLYCQAGYVPRDRDKAEQWYKRAVKKGYVPAMYELGDIYLNSDREKEGLELIKQAAEGGVAEAYETLGYYYLSHDEEKAIAAFDAAAKAGITSALTTLGAIYVDNGDIKKGLAAYEQAVKDGDTIAASLLGYQYYEGETVERDYEKAFYWYSRAVVKGYPHTYFGVARCYLYGAGVPRNVKKAVKYLKRAPKFSNSLYELGNCYFNGWGVKQDKQEAKRLWQKAADDDSEEARKALEENFN